MPHPTSEHVVSELKSKIDLPDGWSVAEVTHPAAQAELFLGELNNPDATIEIIAADYVVEVVFFHRACDVRGMEIELPGEIGSVYFESLEKAAPVIEEALDESTLVEMSEEANEAGSVTFNEYFSLPDSAEQQTTEEVGVEWE